MKGRHQTTSGQRGKGGSNKVKEAAFLTLRRGGAMADQGWPEMRPEVASGSRRSGGDLLLSSSTERSSTGQARSDIELKKKNKITRFKYKYKIAFNANSFSRIIIITEIVCV